MRTSASPRRPSRATIFSRTASARSSKRCAATALAAGQRHRPARRRIKRSPSTSNRSTSLLTLAIARTSSATLVLIGVLPPARRRAAHVGVPLAIVGCIAAVRGARRALEDDRRVAADQPLRFALALQRVRRADLHRSSRTYDLWFAGGFVLGDRRDPFRLRDDVERRLHAGRPVAAVVLDQDPRADRRLVVRLVHGRVRRLGALPVQIRRGAPLRADARVSRSAAGNAGAVSVRRRRLRAHGARRERRAHRHAARSRRPPRPAIRSRCGSPGCRRSRSSTCITYRIVAIGLPLLSLGIITGAMWANEAWGAYWQWDPKETAALLSWIIYAVVHASAHAQRVARRRDALGERRRLRLDHVLLPRREHLDQRPALVQDVDAVALCEAPDASAASRTSAKARGSRRR